MDKVKKQLSTVTNTIDKTQVRTRAMERNLRDVESLPAEEASAMLGLDGSDNELPGDTEEEG